MAHPYQSQYAQQMSNLPPVQTQQPQQQHQPQRPYSPSPYQNSPGAMSPNPGGIPPAKRQRLSPNPPSPYPSPYQPQSPYASSPPPGPYMSHPGTPSMGHPPPSFHQPQPYPQPNNMDSRPIHGSMPPPKVPYSKTQDTSELEKANPRDMDVNNISDVLTGSGIDLRAEEENLLGTRYGNSFNSQTSSTISPHGSFNQWSQTSGHGAFQGTGPLSQSVSQEQQEEELKQKHIRAARALAEHSQSPLSDPFLQANVVRRKVSERAYEHGIGVNLEGLFDKIPQVPQNVTRTTMQGANGESIQRLEADSLLNREASFVEVLTLLTLAAEERVRTVLEDSLALSRGRQNTSHGVVPPNLADLAVTNGDVKTTTALPTNLSKTAWEAPDSAISPMTVPPMKKLSAARLPTPPTDAPPTPQPTISFPNHIALGLKRRAAEDRKWEEERIARRQKRLQASTSAATDAPPIPVLPIPEKMTKKERDRIAKIGQTEEVLHRKANETASMALGGKKKYSWMTGGGGGLGGGLGGGSGASTPRLNTAVGGTASGTATPAQQPAPGIDRGLIARKRTFGDTIELGAIGKGIQVRDVIHVLELDGREKKTLVQILARLKNTDNENEAPAGGGRDRPRPSTSTSFSAGSR